MRGGHSKACCHWRRASSSNAEILSFSEHAVNSPILQEYVMLTKETALNASRKMGSYLTDENGPETPDSIGGAKLRLFLTFRRPVTPEAAGSSPVTPALSAFEFIGFPFLGKSARRFVEVFRQKEFQRV